MKKNIYTLGLLTFAAVTIFISILIILGRVVPELKLDGNADLHIVMIIGVIIVLINAIIYKDILAPPFILSLIWLIPMYGACEVYEYRGIFSFFNKLVSVEVVVILFNAILLFSLGGLIIHRKIINYEPNRSKKTFFKVEWNDKRMKNVIYFLFFLGMTAYAYAVLLKGSIPMFAENVLETRDNFRPPFWGNFFVFLVFTVILAVIRISYVGFKKGYFTLLLGIVCILAITFSTARVDLIYATIISSVAYFIIQRNTNPKFSLFKVVIRFSVVFLFFILLFQEVAKARGINEKAVLFVKGSPLTATYLGYGGPTAIKNFQRIIDEDIKYPATNGKFIFRSILWFVGFRDEVDIGNYFMGPNTATWLYDYYIDFGILGVIFIPFLVGSFSHYIYIKMLTTGRLSWIIVYGFVLLNTIITINGDRFFGVSNTIFAFGFITLYLLYKYRFKLK